MWFSDGGRERREKRGEREERKWKREERESGSHNDTWTPHQHLIIILTLFDNFNGINYDKG